MDSDVSHAGLLEVTGGKQIAPGKNEDRRPLDKVEYRNRQLNDPDSEVINCHMTDNSEFCLKQAE